MYGTIGRLRLDSEGEAGALAQLEEFSSAGVPGARSVYLYRTHADPHCFYVVLMFEDKESFREYAALEDTLLYRLSSPLHANVEWEDGEIIYEGEIAYGGL